MATWDFAINLMPLSHHSLMRFKRTKVAYRALKRYASTTRTGLWVIREMLQPSCNEIFTTSIYLIVCFDCFAIMFSYLNATQDVLPITLSLRGPHFTSSCSQFRVSSSSSSNRVIGQAGPGEHQLSFSALSVSSWISYLM